MKNNNTLTYALPNSRESRAGAMACVQAMEDIQRIIDKGANTRAVYDKQLSRSDRTMLKAAEPGLSSFMEGFVKAFAEYICLERAGEVNLENWLPYAAMTEAEVEEDKKEFWKDL